jgi:hypothetical protein
MVKEFYVSFPKGSISTEDDVVVPDVAIVTCDHVYMTDCAVDFVSGFEIDILL